MKKFNNTMNSNKKIQKFGVMRQSSLKQAKLLMDMERIPEPIIKPIEDEEIKEDIIEIVDEEIMTVVEEEQSMMTFDVIHANNIKQDIIIPKEETIIIDKPKSKTKLADAIKIMILKRKNGWT